MTMEYIASVFGKILIVARTPIGWLTAFGAYFLPLRGVFELVLAIVMADLATGIIASYVSKIPRSSRRARRSVMKLLCYLTLIWLFYKFETECGISELVCSYKVIAGFLFVIEIISILENMAVITGHNVFLKLVRLVRGTASKGGDIIKDILDEKNITNEKYKSEK